MIVQKKEIVFIVNPISGKESVEDKCKAIDSVLDSSIYDYKVLVTERAGHAAEIAKACSGRGTDIVVAVGGDGTVNEVASGLIGTQTALGIIPCGSGNGLARHLGIPMNHAKAVELLNQCRIESIDYGVVEGHPFFCTCGVGYDAWISHKFAESGKRGVLPYIENAITEFFAYKSEEYSLTVDGRKLEEKAFLMTCANADQWGNNALIAPSASLQDGLLDLCIVKPFTPFEAPVLAAKLMDGRAETSKRVKYMKCQNILIQRSRPGVAHYDGEPCELGSTIHVGIVKSGLRVAVSDDRQKI